MDRLIAGTGVFARLGIDVFDDYWMNYYTSAMAREAGFNAPPYTNLKSYQTFKQQGSQILSIPEEEIEAEVETLSEEGDEELY